jgi:predicted aspartyl protease
MHNINAQFIEIMPSTWVWSVNENLKNNYQSFSHNELKIHISDEVSRFTPVLSFDFKRDFLTFPIALFLISSLVLAGKLTISRLLQKAQRAQQNIRAFSHLMTVTIEVYRAKDEEIRKQVSRALNPWHPTSFQQLRDT